MTLLKNNFRSYIRNLCIFLIVCAIAILSFHQEVRGQDAKAVQHWYRGNTHTHGRYSDKNSFNDIPEIAKWYKKAGYDFLAIAEHNDRLSKKKVICHDEAADPPRFIMLCGLELSGSHHLTSLGINRFVGEGTSLQEGVDETLAAGGVPILNHPREPVLKASEILRTKNLNHFEVFNGNNPEDTPACERLWDTLLSSPSGRIFYAVASDDNHYKKSKVGRGWIMVESPVLTKDAIKENIRKGNFYATTGIFLRTYEVTGKSISVDTENGSVISFIGKQGKILKTVKGALGSYQIKGNEYYIRVRISNSQGQLAWTQPVFIK